MVWSIEAGPHMPDKVKYGSEMMRVLKPGGILVVADWNQRDDRQKPLNYWEKPVMRQLLDQWSHPAFSSIEGFSEQIAETGLVEGEVATADWTPETLPSWLESIWQGIVRPQGLIKFGFSGFIKSLREVPTMLLMRLIMYRPNVFFWRHAENWKFQSFVPQVRVVVGTQPKFK